MLPFTKIICPTDFSVPSLKALDAAIELAQQYNAELLLVHVSDPVPTLPESGMVSAPTSPVSFDVSTYTNMLHRQASAQLDEICREHLPKKLEAQRIIASGQPAEQIMKLAREHEADLIVIATNGRTGVSHLLFGSVTEKVVRMAGCPVLTIRPGACHKNSD
jgi:nucleotide-binding universal stress UspA family protein